MGPGMSQQITNESNEPVAAPYAAVVIMKLQRLQEADTIFAYMGIRDLCKNGSTGMLSMPGVTDTLIREQLVTLDANNNVVVDADTKAVVNFFEENKDRFPL